MWPPLPAHRTHSVVLMLSVGVTASRDSVTPAPKPATTVRGPESFPSESARSFLYWSNETKPALDVVARPSVLASSFLAPRGVLRTDSGLGRVPYNQRRAPGIPLPAERRPGHLLAIGEPPIELRPRFGDYLESGRERHLGGSGPEAPKEAGRGESSWHGGGRLAGSYTQLGM